MESPTSGYVSVGVLARGGMGEVRLGLRQTGDFQRLVAIKRLRREHRDDPSFRRMFLDEAKIAGLIRHPNVVSVLDVGSDHEGPFLVMDYIEGVTAARILRDNGGRRLPLQIAARVVHQVALGLAAAHELRGANGKDLQLIHRDISPQNILIGFDGVARLTDFGIAKAAGLDRHTTTGLLKGKVGYMSPEQLRFERPTQKSDLFSLGVVLFELLSGRRLYRGNDAVEVAQKILSGPLPDIFSIRDDVPDPLVELSFELLGKDPADRPESAREVGQRLGEILDELVATEGSLGLDEYLASRFADEWERIKTKSESLVNEWQTTTQHAPAPMAVRRRAVVGGLALAALVFGASAVGLALHDPPRPGAKASITKPDVLPEETVIADEPESEPEPEVDEPERPRMVRRRPRTRTAEMTPTMRGFDALGLIRMDR